MLPDSSRLGDCKPGLWVSADKRRAGTDELPNVDLFNRSKEGDMIATQSMSNLQKKIMPWQLVPGLRAVDVPTRRLVGDERHPTDSNGREVCSLVLVASLIDKAPNLGGENLSITVSLLIHMHTEV